MKNPIEEHRDTMNQSYSVNEIIDAFCQFDGVYRRAHVDAALAMREEITPRLIELLEMVRSEPARYAGDEEFAGNLYAVMLLSYWGESGAHQVIVDLFRLPTKQVDDLFGDMITADLPLVLFRTCGGNTKLIEALAADPRADEYCRASALTALTYAVAEGVAPRNEMIAFLRTLFQPSMAARGSFFWNGLVLAANDLHPQELIEEIRQAFQDDMVDESIIEYADVQATLRQDPARGMVRIKEEIKRQTHPGFHKWMDWWAMFEDEPVRPSRAKEAPAPTAAPSLPFVQAAQNAEKLTRQQRRKLEREQAKALTQRRKGR
jgi:hypothetical protein